MKSNLGKYSLFPGRIMNLRCTLGPGLQPVEVGAQKRAGHHWGCRLCWGSFTKMLAFLSVSRKRQAQQGYSPWKKEEEEDKTTKFACSEQSYPHLRRLGEDLALVSREA